MQPLVAILVALSGASAGSVGMEPPPGLVLVPGGRTRIGITQDELKRLLSIDPNSQNYAGALSAETPQHELAVESFYAMPTEVTNEQFLAFVRATGSKPPQSWAEDAIRAGAEEFQREQDRARNEAGTQGLPLPEPASFDPRAFWDENWPGQPCAIPAGDERRPVVFVDYAMAARYARWAGLRLPLEEEYQRAVRGDGDRKYPWGDAWDNDKYAATLLLKKKGGPFVVGSFPAGASKQGLYDLAGNVWEWTQSPYLPYAGYEARVFEFGYGSKVRQVNALAPFDEARKVVVGGSFQNGNLMCRATTRRDVAPRSATDALGFRCVRTPRSGVDAASAILAEQLTDVWRPREDDAAVVYDPAEATAFERWETGTPPELPGQPLAPGYALITGHDELVWCPVRQLRAIDPGTFDKLCQQEGLVQLGFLATSVPLVEPELASGVYQVAFRAKGLPRFLSTEDPEKRLGRAVGEGAPLEELLKIDIRYDHLILSDLHGRPLRALRQGLEFGTLKDARFELDEREGRRVVRLSVGIACRTSLKGFGFELALLPEPGRLSGEWRGEPRAR